MTFRPVYVTSDHPAATAYGTALDYIWATNGHPGETGSNVARRAAWEPDTYISVLPCVPNAPDDPNGYDPQQRWVFREDGAEYEPEVLIIKNPDGSETIIEVDLIATDWMVGEVE